jgi:hypothetical protein
MKFIFTYAAAAMIVATGCAGRTNEYDAVVTGTVTIDGELANAGTVTFHPASGGKVAIGRIHPDGSYSLRTGQGDLHEVDGGTVVPGEYIVTVSITGPPVESAQVIPGAPPLPGASLVAAKYAAKDSSDLKHTVKAGSQIIILELERAESPPPEDPSEAAAGAQEAVPGAGSEAEPAEVEPATAAPSQTPPANTPPASAPATDESATEQNGENASS